MAMRRNLKSGRVHPLIGLNPPNETTRNSRTLQRKGAASGEEAKCWLVSEIVPTPEGTFNQDGRHVLDRRRRLDHVPKLSSACTIGGLDVDKPAQPQTCSWTRMNAPAFLRGQGTSGVIVYLSSTGCMILRNG
jgi:hypothetical protein